MERKNIDRAKDIDRELYAIERIIKSIDTHGEIINVDDRTVADCLSKLNKVGLRNLLLEYKEKIEKELKYM